MLTFNIPETIGYACVYFCVLWTAGTAIAYAILALSAYRVGGLTFWRVGRLGGSVYVARLRAESDWRGVEV